MTFASRSADARVTRTQRQIFEAFADLVQRRRYDEISVGDIVAEAGIGRSTFYEHYRDKDAVLRLSLRFPFSPLADLFFDEVPAARVHMALDHLWQRRSLARILFREHSRAIAVQTFIDLADDGVRARGGDPDVASLRADIAFKSHGMIAALDSWVTGRLALNAEALAEAVFNHANLALALRSPER